MSFIRRLLTFNIRKKRRLKAMDGIFVVLGNSLTKNQVGDISMYGLSFYYIDRGIKLRKGPCELKILINNDLWMGEVPCKIVSDIDTAEIRFQNKKIKRQSVRFGRLSHSQKSKLKYILNNFTLHGP
jgi:hypothetical protein